jgi:predicted transcriptional regulator
MTTKHVKGTRMLSCGTVTMIHEMALAGRPVRAIARELGVARNTVRKYVRGAAVAAVTDGGRTSATLDPSKRQVRAVRAGSRVRCAPGRGRGQRSA